MPGRTRPSSGSQSPVRSIGVPARVALTATVAAFALQPFVVQPAGAAVSVRPTSAKALPAAVDAVPGRYGPGALGVTRSYEALCAGAVILTWERSHSQGRT